MSVDWELEGFGVEGWVELDPEPWIPPTLYRTRVQEYREASGPGRTVREIPDWAFWLIADGDEQLRPVLELAAKNQRACRAAHRLGGKDAVLELLRNL